MKMRLNVRSRSGYVLTFFIGVAANTALNIADSHDRGFIVVTDEGRTRCG